MMIRSAFVGMLGILLGSFAGTSRAADCRLSPLAALEVEILEHGRVILPVKINGRAAWIYLHMSSGVPTIYPTAVAELGLKPVPQNDLVMYIGDKAVTEKVVVESLLLGTANFANWDMYVQPGTPSGSTKYRDAPLIGGLTSAFLTQVDMELNLAEKRVNLFRQTTCDKNKVVYWGGVVTAVDMIRDETGLMSFPMEIDGKKVEATFNTHSGASRISEIVTDRFFGFTRDSPGITREPDEDGDDEASYRAMALTAKGLALKNVKVQLRDDRTMKCDANRHPRLTGPPEAPFLRYDVIGFDGCLSRAPLAIGTDLLRRLRIYIAPKEGRIYFTRAAEATGATAPSP